DAYRLVLARRDHAAHFLRHADSFVRCGHLLLRPYDETAGDRPCRAGGGPGRRETRGPPRRAADVACGPSCAPKGHREPDRDGERPACPAAAAGVRATAPVGPAGRCRAVAADRGDGPDAAAGGPGPDRRSGGRPGHHRGGAADVGARRRQRGARRGGFVRAGAPRRAGGTGLMRRRVPRDGTGGLGADRVIAGAVLLVSALVVADAVLGGVGSYVLRRTAESVVLGARRSLSSYLLRLRVPAVDRSEPGDLMARITSDTTLLREVTTDSLVGVGTGGLTLVATVVLMGFVDPVLLAVTLAVIAGAGTVLGVIVPRISRASRQAQDAVGVMGASLERVLGALRTVKASGAEPREE